MAVVLTLLVAAAGFPTGVQAQEIAGYWRGSGTVAPAEGQRERVRCRVTFRRISARGYGFSARCASQSANINQSGSVYRTGRSSYAGEFFNPDYNISGRVRIRVSGGRQYVTLSSAQGTGQLTLFKR